MKLNSIQIKTTALVVGILVLVIGIVITFSVNNQKQDLLTAAKNTLSINTDMLNSVLKSIMLNGEAPIAVNTMGNLKQLGDFREVELYRTDGNRAFNDYQTLEFVNQYQNQIRFAKTDRVKREMIEDPSFQYVLKNQQPLDREMPQTQEMEYFFPIRNERQCWDCHGSVKESGSLRGIAHFKISIAGIFSQINRARLILILVLALGGLLFAFALVFLLQYLVIRPVLKIGQTVTLFGEGNMDIQLQLKRDDELGILAEKINTMFKEVRERFRLSKYVSRSTNEMVRSEEGSHLGGRNKKLTVLFSDIRGFTAYSESHPADEVIENLNLVLQLQAEIIEKYKGDIDKFIGDAVMAIFDDALSAVKCAYEIIVELKEFNKLNRSELYVGIGINSGEVIAGNIGSQTRKEFAVIGDTVNLASRLSDLAKANMVLLSSSTKDLLEGQIDCLPVKNQSIKGKSRTVNFFILKKIRQKKD